MLPTRYLYLVDVETNEPLAIFAMDHFDREGEVILYEALLRAQHNTRPAAWRSGTACLTLCPMRSCALSSRDSRKPMHGPSKNEPCTSLLGPLRGSISTGPSHSVDLS